MRYVWAVVAVLVLSICWNVAGEAGEINEGFDFYDQGRRPWGWDFVGCAFNSDAEMTIVGNAAPSVKMIPDGSRMRTVEYTRDGGDSTLTFFLASLDTNPSSSLRVREYDGAAWTLLTMIRELPSPGTPVYPTLALNASSSQRVELIYQLNGSGTEGGIAIDDVNLTNVTPEEAPEPEPDPLPEDFYLVIAHDDYTGDGQSNIAVYDSSSGDWSVEGVGVIGTLGGGEYDLPAPGDYDGDGIADLAIYNRATAQWTVQSVGGAEPFIDEVWGVAGVTLPVPGDYTGDGTTDLAAWGTNAGRWWIKGHTVVSFGTGDVRPIPGDYDNDGSTDIAFFQPNTRCWHFLDLTPAVRSWGNIAGDNPRPMDYYGGGKVSMAIYRTVNSRWLILDQDATVGINPRWGTVAMAPLTPVVGDFDGDGEAELTVYRHSDDKWLVQPDTTGVEFAVDTDTDIIVTGAPDYKNYIE
jgi:hypothetical protein